MTRKDASKEDFETAHIFREQGWGFYRIAKKLGVSKTAVRGWFNKGIKPYSIWTEEEKQNYKNKVAEKSRGRKHRPESIEKIRLSHLGSLNPNYRGKSTTPESIEKCRLKTIGQKRTEEFKQHLSDIRWGEKNPMWKGNHCTEDSARQRAERLYGAECPEDCEIHHIDGNPRNNNRENISFVTRKQHMIVDGRLEKFKKVGHYKNRDNF